MLVEVTYTLTGIHLVVHHVMPARMVTVTIDQLWYVGGRGR